MQPNPNTAAAIAWYTRNRDRIAAALPLTVDGATYHQHWPLKLDGWIALADQMPPNLQECYICRPLRQIKEAIADVP